MAFNERGEMLYGPLSTVDWPQLSKPNEAGGVKYDYQKPRYDLIPFDQLEDTVKVLTFGAKKYTPDNWQKVEPYRYIGAAFRHLVARCMGEIYDKETGLPHTAHAVCCLWFLGWHDAQKKN
jgi:hypothetical protein